MWMDERGTSDERTLPKNILQMERNSQKREREEREEETKVEQKENKMEGIVREMFLSITYRRKRPTNRKY